MSVAGTQLKEERRLVRKKPLKVVRRYRSGLMKRHPGTRVAPVLVVAGLLIAATVFTVLLERVLLSQSGFRMAQLRDRMIAEEAEHAELMLQAAKLASSERIERYAIEQLGMVYPTEVIYVMADVRTRSSVEKLRKAPEGALVGSDGLAVGGGVAP